MTLLNRRVRSRSLLAGILLLGVSGAWISGELVKRSADIWGGAAANSGLFARVCQAAARVGFDCDATVKNGWGQINLPLPAPSRNGSIHLRSVAIPVAFLGLAYFVFIVVWFTLVSEPGAVDGRLRRVPTLVTACAAAASLGLLSIMALGLAPWCVWCVATHLINFAMIAAIWRLGVIARHDRSGPRPRAAVRPAFYPAPEASRAIAVALILVAGLWMYRREHIALAAQMNKLRPYKALVTSLRADPEFVLREFHAQPRHTIPPRHGATLEAGGPRLTVFTDFECPACLRNSQIIRKRIVSAFGGRLLIDVRHFPLCRECNDTVKRAFHRNACDAARAAEAARLQGGQEAFERMYDLLFRNQKRLGPQLYRTLAVQIGLDANRLIGDMHGEVVARIIRNDLQLARELGVHGTPTMFLNGRRITELAQGETFWRIVAQSPAALHARSDTQPGVLSTLTARNQESPQP